MTPQDKQEVDWVALQKTGFVTVYKPMAGWKPIHYWWNDEDPNSGFWEPWETYPFAFGTKAEAEVLAKTWAEDLELPYVPSDEKEEKVEPGKAIEKIREALNGAPLVEVELSEQPMCCMCGQYPVEKKGRACMACLFENGGHIE